MDWIARAFPGAPDLQSRVRNAQSQSPELRKLFNDIALFIDSQNREKNSASALESKKRKLDEAPNGTQHDHSRTPWDTGAVATISDISFSVPVRKKLRLEIGSQASQGIRATNTQTGDVELQIQWRELGMSL